MRSAVLLAAAAGLSGCQSWDIRVGAVGLFGKAMHFVSKIELGGVTGMVVLLIGGPAGDSDLDHRRP
jgi:hypothetical protein